MLPSLLDFLKHILEECDFIIESVEDKSKDKFIADKILSRAIVRSLEIIGEATKKLPDDLRARYSHINWNEMACMRDILIHDYFGVDYDVVWSTVTNDIPELKIGIQKIIEKES